MTDDIIGRYESVSKSYGGLTVVKDLDLDIRRGEFLSLLGPSGSGKTTTLMMLAGLQSPSSGHIFLNGRPIDGIPPHRRNIGVVFQNYALFPHMTIAENLAYPLKARRLPKPEIARRVQRGLEMVKLHAFAQRRPTELSGGQQQRVALARALVFEPSVVLLDEPLGALDRQLRETMQLELKQLHRETGVTMVYVTHDQAEAMTMSDRVAVFNDGKLLQCAPPREIYDRPESAFVAEFVGENNRLVGTIVASGEDGCTVKTDTGLVIRSRPQPGLAVGASVFVYLRPERVLVGPAAASCENRYVVEVADAIFLGDHTRLRIDLPGNPNFTVKHNFFGDARPPGPADRIEFGWTTRAPQVVAT
ncbi:spermidine/putrescine ABC transporter ATP-binding protein [Mesorhizobium sp. Root695]|uniref:ABC transporter ATP-binding protein n=1 Tax=Mesorhizobium sp. Root695 TaxID=1736589 RepID=UPI00070B4CCC|nr:ABC transporter ATP-binding protein [Mesorhizobium sp. Root695]KRB30993.1 spermidine/putrescine ABC transporter ATP-binding protein [Mesorhizobium sp. Root695]